MPMPYQLPTRTIKSMESKVTEPPMGILKILIMEATVPRAMAMDAKEISLAEKALFLPKRRLPSNSMAIRAMTRAV